jgi:hypothetical protein
MSTLAVLRRGSVFNLDTSLLFIKFTDEIEIKKDGDGIVIISDLGLNKIYEKCDKLELKTLAD